jgi:hypothetical protein
MRRTLFFLVAVVGTTLALAWVSWHVDPFNYRWDSRLVPSALRNSPPCLISDDLVGSVGWLRLKEDFVNRATRTVVFGTSRVLEFRARGGESSFVNAGMPGTGPETIVPLAQAIERRAGRPLTLYLGVDVFWLNLNWNPGISFLAKSWRSYVSRDALDATLATIRDRPAALFSRWQRLTVGGRCVLARSEAVAHGRQNAWLPDGSLEYSFDLMHQTRTASQDPFAKDFVTYYRQWTRLDPSRLTQLATALTWLRRHKWHVVGFVAPASTTYVERLATAADTGPEWRSFGRVVPRLFSRYGFPFVDLRDVRSVPCAQDAFVDTGWHPNVSCSMRVRTRLDAIATAHWPDGR